MVYRAASPDRVSTVSTWEPVRDTASEAPEVSSQAAEVDSVKGEVTAETSQAAPAVSTASASAQLESSHGSRGSQQATGRVIYKGQRAHVLQLQYNTAEEPCGHSYPNAWAAPGQGSAGPALASGEAPRPTDDLIIAQENSIRAAEAEKIALVGDVESLSSLQQEYAAGSQVFVQKIRSLEGTYSSIRRTRGDGNCFFRSFIFGFLEHLTRTVDLKERNRVVTCLRQWGKKLVESGFQELVFEDAMEVVIDQLNSLGQQDAMTVVALENNMREAMISNMIVMLLRMLTSCEIQRREDFFAPFILGMSDGEMSVEQFCRRCVEPMGEESDHVHIVALSDALQVPVRVLYLDRSLGSVMAGVSDADAASVNHHDFVPDALAAAGHVKPRVTILYRPGHYDIIYPIQE